MSDAEARRRIREDLDATLVVEAAAGTGKTTELVGRVVAMLSSGRAQLRAMVAVTFTEKAAGEMKLRLRGALEAARGDARDAAAGNLTLALEELEAARIGTIHSFCADLLHEHPIEAGVDPLFEVAAQDEATQLLEQAFDAWFEGALAAPPEGLRRALRRRARRYDALPSDKLRDAVRTLADQRDFTAPWTRPPIARQRSLDDVVRRLEELADIALVAEDPGDWLSQNLAEVGRFVAELHHKERVRGRDHDGLEAELGALSRLRSWKYRGRQPRFGDIDADTARALRDAAHQELERVVAACDADLAALLRADLEPVLAGYEALKRRAGKLDFLDLLLRARDLLRDQPAVRREVQQRFSHVFVDEFQDTDPLQAEILLLACADDPAEDDWTRARPRPGKLFLVGDPKQSIYRFRRADVALYARVKAQLVAAGAQALYLTTSFRATPALQSAVNAAFEPMMSAGGEQAAYVPLEPFRADADGQPALVALSVPRPYGDRGQVTKWRVEESVPDCVGAFVDWLVNASGWEVTERDDPQRRVPIAPRHICLLLKRFQSFGDDVTKPYVSALEKRRVPHVLVGGRSFHRREEIVAIESAVAAIEWPDDELAVYASLRGPFFALHDADLYAYRRALGRLHPLRRHEAPLPPTLAPVAEALGVLGELHQRRNRRPIADTISLLLEATRAHAGIAIWPHGEQALANVMRVTDLARRFEAVGASSFRAFVERLEADAARGEAAEAPVVEEGTEGVRVMTVHRAKGLEFPVVILCEPSAPATWSEPSRYIDTARNLWAQPLCGCLPHDLVEHGAEALARDKEEAVRLAYVAATRARDLLVVPAVGDDPVEGWLDVLRPALYPTLKTCRRPERAPGCPPFGDDSVLERPASARFHPSANIAPGLHRPKAGAHQVVWWDPRALELDRDFEVGLQQERLLTADEAGVAAAAGIEAHRRWREGLAATAAHASVPLVRSEAVTRFSHAQLGPAPAAVAQAATEVARAGRPQGKRFGTLVHAVLAAVALDAGAGEIEALCRLHGRLLGAPDDERAAAALAVAAALAHPLMRQAAASAQCRREAALALRLEDGLILEGAVDLAFLDDSGWTIVDFKTDLELGERLASYEHQLATYARAISAATGKPARGVLLSV
jgi:ATP-dependent exoDNAse (exonuclease V) beta subunit